MKNLVLVILILALIGAAAYDRSLWMQNRGQVGTIAALSQELKKYRGETRTDVQTQKNVVSQLQLELDVKRRNLDDLATRVQRAENKGPEQGTFPDTVAELQAEQGRIADLQSRLRAVRAQEQDAKSRQSTTQEAGRAAQQQDDSSLIARIQTEQLDLAKLEAQAIALRERPLDLSAVQELQQLQPQIQAKRDLIQNLNLQRQAGLQAWSNAQGNAAAQSSQELAGLQSTESDLMSQLQTVQQSYAKLSQDVDQAKKNQNGGPNLEQLRAAYLHEKADVDSMDAQLAIEKQRLAELSQ